MLTLRSLSAQAEILNELADQNRHNPQGLAHVANLAAVLRNDSYTVETPFVASLDELEQKISDLNVTAADDLSESTLWLDGNLKGVVALNSFAEWAPAKNYTYSIAEIRSSTDLNPRPSTMGKPVSTLLLKP